MSYKAVGLHDLEVSLPALVYPISELAALRGLEYAKLQHGLGLLEMAVPDGDEDVVTLGATAVIRLIERQQLDPRSLGRLYLGTESAVDGAKPTATYIADLVERHFEAKFGAHCLAHCDVVDLTFACIGAVDALENCLDWIKAGDNRRAIVLASDTARYRMESTGEYTQGAGAVAMLLCENPALLRFSGAWGVSMQSEHDFFKPIRGEQKTNLLQSVLDAADSSANVAEVQAKLESQAHPLLGHAVEIVYMHDDTPIFDGQFSNQCYQDRMQSALEHFKRRNQCTDQPILQQWAGIVFHLPYAFHGKRMLPTVLMAELVAHQQWESLFPGTAANEEGLKILSKSDFYQKLVAQKIAPGHHASSSVGNLYTGSIFLALASWLDQQQHQDIDGKIGFIAYGSGSKSKVFEAELQPDWQVASRGIDLASKLESRTRINSDTYVALHRGDQRSFSMKPKLIKKTGYAERNGLPFVLSYQLR